MLGSRGCFPFSVVYDRETWLNTQSRCLLLRTCATVSDPVENTNCEKDLICLS